MMSKSPTDNKAKHKILSKVLNLEPENLQTQGGKNYTKAQEKYSFKIINQKIIKKI